MFRKSKEELKKDAAAYEKISGDAALTTMNKPSKYKFVFQGNQKDLTGLPDDYSYNWFLGGRSNRNKCLLQLSNPLELELELELQLDLEV